jgi:pectinesterase
MLLHDRRAVLAAGGVLAMLAGPVLAAVRRSFDAGLDRDGVGRDGVKGFRTLAAALDAAPADGARPFRILVPAGRWREQVAVTKPNIHLVGEGRASSVIVFNEYAAGRNRPGGPAEIATVTVTAPSFRARALTIANDFDYPATCRSRSTRPHRGQRGPGHGAEAGRGLGPRLFEDVALTGWQDTLFAAPAAACFNAA